MTNERSDALGNVGYVDQIVLGGMKRHYDLNGWMPSVRELSTTCGLSLSTVQRCLRSLERHGLVEQYGPQGRYRLTEEEEEIAE